MMKTIIIIPVQLRDEMKWKMLMATRFPWQKQFWTIQKNGIPCFCFTSLRFLEFLCPQNFFRYTRSFIAFILCFFSGLYCLLCSVYPLSHTLPVFGFNIQSMSFSYLSFEKQCLQLKWLQFNSIQLNSISLNNWFSGYPNMILKSISTIILNQHPRQKIKYKIVFFWKFKRHCIVYCYHVNRKKCVPCYHYYYFLSRE